SHVRGGSRRYRVLRIALRRRRSAKKAIAVIMAPSTARSLARTIRAPTATLLELRGDERHLQLTSLADDRGGDRSADQLPGHQPLGVVHALDRRALEAGGQILGAPARAGGAACPHDPHHPRRPPPS